MMHLEGRQSLRARGWRGNMAAAGDRECLDV